MDKYFILLIDLKAFFCTYKLKNTLLKFLYIRRKMDKLAIYSNLLKFFTER